MTNTTFTIDSALHWTLRDAALYAYRLALESASDELRLYYKTYDNIDLDDDAGWREQIAQGWEGLKCARVRLADLDGPMEALGSARVAGYDAVIDVPVEHADGLYDIVEYAEQEVRARIEDQVQIGADLDAGAVHEDAEMLSALADLREDIKRAMKRRPEPRPGVPPVCEIPDELREDLHRSADDLIGYECGRVHASTMNIDDDLLRQGAEQARDELRRLLPAAVALDAGERRLTAEVVAALAGNGAINEANALAEVEAAEEPDTARAHLDAIDALCALSKHAQGLVDDYELAKDGKAAVEISQEDLASIQEAPSVWLSMPAPPEPAPQVFAGLSPDQRYAAAFALVEEARSIAGGLIDQHKEFINAGRGNWQTPAKDLVGFARGLANLLPSLAALTGADITPEFRDEPEDANDADGDLQWVESIDDDLIPYLRGAAVLKLADAAKDLGVDDGEGIRDVVAYRALDGDSIDPEVLARAKRYQHWLLTTLEDLQDVGWPGADEGNPGPLLARTVSVLATVAANTIHEELRDNPPDDPEVLADRGKIVARLRTLAAVAFRRVTSAARATAADKQPSPAEATSA